MRRTGTLDARHPERGQAVLVTVLIIALVLAAVGAMLFRAAVTDSTLTGHSVAKGQALQAAQAGVSAAYAAINTGPVSSAPCRVTGTLGSAPSKSSYTVTVTYYRVATTSALANEISCTTTAQTVKTARELEIRSVGTDLGEKSTMLSEADLSPPSLSGTVFGDAISVNSAVSLSSADAFNVTGHAIFTTGSATCGGGGDIHGTLVVVGTISLSGGCSISGSAVAGGEVTVPSGSPSVAGKLISTSSTKNPGIDIAGDPTLHTMLAGASIVYPTWWTPARGSEVVQDDTSLTPPPPQTFPTIHWTAAGWEAKGYTVVATSSTPNKPLATCAKAYAAIYAANTATAKGEAVYTSCDIAIPPPSHADCPNNEYTCVLTLKRNLAIFSTAGFVVRTAGKVDVSTATAGVTRDLALIVPTGTSCTSQNGLITVKGTIGANVDALVATPCTVTMSGSAHITAGEIYAGHFTPDGGMSYGLPLTIPGASGGSQTTTGPPTVGIVYEREGTS